MKNGLLTIITGGFAVFILSGYSNGMNTSGLNRTGAASSTPDCAGAGCHNANNSNLDLNINLRVPGGGYISSTDPYNKETVYWVVISGHTSSNAYPEFNYQFASRTNTNDQGLALQTSNHQSVPVGGVEVTELTQPAPKSGFNNYVDSFLWLSPRTGTVTLYATMTAANNDGFQTGDISNNSTRSFIINSIDDISEKTKINVFPNPVKDDLHISIKDGDRGEYVFSAINMRGQAVWEQHINVSGAQTDMSVNTSEWTSGNYILKIKKDGAMRTIPVLKR